MARHRFGPLLIRAGLPLALAAFTFSSFAAESSPPGPLRLESQAFGRTAVVEIAGATPDAAASARAALDRLVELDRQLADAVAQANSDGDGGGGEREIVVDRTVADLLSRTLQFCDWSGGAHGPLGGVLEDHWRAVAGNPKPPAVPEGALESAACNHLAVDPEARGEQVRVRIAGDSRLDLDGFAPGFAVDQAIDLLRQRGVDNALVRVGRIQRAIGDGPSDTDRKGWPVLLPAFESYDRPLEELTLHDQALAVVWRADWPSERPLFVDQRSGEPPTTTWATVVVSELAVDAQALGVSALVLGSREGRFRIAGLRPVPSVLWLQGTGKGRPLLMELNWTALRTP